MIQFSKVKYNFITLLFHYLCDTQFYYEFFLAFIQSLRTPKTAKKCCSLGTKNFKVNLKHEMAGFENKTRFMDF